MAQELLDGLAPWPAVDFSAFGPVETRPQTRRQKVTAAVMGRNWVAIPHVTHQDEADVGALEQRRRGDAAAGRPKLSPVIFVIKAVAAALRAFPQFNASLAAGGTELVLKDYVHIGVAIDTPGGLLVGVVRDCDAKPLADIAAKLTDLSTKARAKGLSMDEMSGGCMTVTSLGHIGGTGFTPIVNAPEVAILGLTRTVERPVRGVGDAIEWRPFLPLSLSYDHRVINGADAARFTRFVADRLASAQE